MSDAKRYAPCLHDYEAIMEESAHGGYVRGRDYEELRTQLAAKDRELERLQTELGKGLRVGRYAIMPFIDGGHWIEIAEGDGQGEGMQTHKLTELIDKFYAEQF